MSIFGFAEREDISPPHNFTPISLSPETASFLERPNWGFFFFHNSGNSKLIFKAINKGIGIAHRR